MTLAEYIDDLFKVATGWLGWSPAEVYHTPIPQIALALEGRIEWAIKTNPFASEKKEHTDVGERFKAMAASRGVIRRA